MATQAQQTGARLRLFGIQVSSAEAQDAAAFGARDGSSRRLWRFDLASAGPIRPSVGSRFDVWARGLLELDGKPLTSGEVIEL